MTESATSLHMNESQKFIYISRYSRWIDEKSRREISWEETVDRYLSFMHKRFAEHPIPKAIWSLIEEQMKAMGTMPSMRAAWAAGPALEENEILGYNCCYTPFIDLRAPCEMFYILMCGTGVGFSVESNYIDRMPSVAKWHGAGAGVHVVGDSREGWAESLYAGFNAWFNGLDIEFNYSKVRPRGARLKKMGGRASGPAPLKKLHDFCRETIRKAQGRKLTDLEWLDIGNMIGDVVVVGGVRRASEITFSDLSSDAIRYAKTGNFPEHRFMSNNSAVYFEKPDILTFMREWLALAESRTGERGIYNVYAIEKHFAKHAKRRVFTFGLRSNPCGEIILRPFEFCNLTEVVVRERDSFDDLVEKVKAAVWIGVLQSSLTNFPYIRDDFRKNCEEERLLGVSLTGQLDAPNLMTPEKLRILKDFAIKTARKAAKLLNINLSVAITTGKPSGTVSQLVDAASGAHARHAKFYLRRYRLSAVDSLFRMMRDQGVVFTPENGQGKADINEKRKKMLAEDYSQEQVDILVPPWAEEDVQTWVCAFPTKAPEGAVTRDQFDAIAQLEWYLKLQENWSEHNQSITVYVRDDEWLKVGAYVYENFDRIVGVSFLPYDGGSYKQAPYEEITEKEYDKLMATFPAIDYSELSKYELEDGTTGAQQLACVAGNCEVI
jgi:ribonucleoside-triphosphate reductase